MALIKSYPNLKLKRKPIRFIKETPMPCMQEIIQKDKGELQERISKIRDAKTLTKIMLAAWQLSCLLAVKLVEEVLAERADRRCHWPKCPECGARIGNKGREERQIKGLIGIVRWKRKIGKCPNGCKIAQIVPLDKELGLRANQRVCDNLRRVACALAIFVPYEIASVLLCMLTGIDITGMTIWNWVQEAGSKAIENLEQELTALQQGERIAAEEIEESVAQLPLLIGGDGVFVPLRPKIGTPKGKTDWREVKVGVFARLKRYINTKGRLVTRLLRRRLVAVLGDIDDFTVRMELQSKKQAADTADTVVWVSDGGRGFWGLFFNLFATYATGILDFYHAAQNLWKATAAWLDGRTKRARQWFTQARHQLRHGQEHLLLSDLKNVLDDPTVDDDTWLAVYSCYEYLNNHRQHIQYSLFKDSLNLPIGSGMVESACKWLIQQRFKCVGMRWSRSGFNNLLHLRLAWVNEYFDQIFEFN